MSQLLIAVIFGAIAAGAAMVALRSRSSSKPSTTKSIPPAMRPAEIDSILESVRLNRVLLWGAALTIFFAFFLPAYWFREPARMAAKEKLFEEQSKERGHTYFSLTTDPVTGASNLKGKECARCHGIKAQGGTNQFLDPNTGVTRQVQVPALNTVFSRYEEPPPGFKDAKAFITETIERGRPTTDMPTWGNKYGGPLTEQEIDDVVNWLQSIQVKQQVDAAAGGDQIFSTICAACHGIGGAGGSGPSMTGGSEARQFPNIADHKAFVTNGSQAGVAYGTSGKGTGGMPKWGGTLTDDQIQKVIEYERSL